MKLLVIAILIVWGSPVSAAQGKAWTPQVKFKLENSNYTETLLWISGFSYALTETAKQSKESGYLNLYCLPSDGNIGSKELLEILNKQYQGKTISAEIASTALLSGIREHFPCK